MTNGGQVGSAEPCGRNVVEADYRAVLRDAKAGAVERSDSTERSEIVKGDERRKLLPGPEQILGLEQAAIEARVCVDGFGQLAHQLWFDAKAVFGGEALNALPAPITIHEFCRAADDGNAAVAQIIEVLDGKIATLLVIHDD